MADEGKPEKCATDSVGKHNPSGTYVIYYIHDLHGLLEGVPGPQSPGAPGGGGSTRAPDRIGGIKAIVETVESWKTKDQMAGNGQVFICVGGDMVSEYRSRSLDQNNVADVWRYLLDQIAPDAWVLGNHELDPEYAESLPDMVSYKPATGCTRNLLWAQGHAVCPVAHEDCPHQDVLIPMWSEHVPHGVASNAETPIVFTGLTVAKAGWREDGHREIPDSYESAQDANVPDHEWKKVCKRFVAEWAMKSPAIGALLKKKWMSEALAGAVDQVGKDKAPKLADEHKSEMVELLKGLLGTKSFYFDDRAYFSSYVVKAGFPKRATALTQKTVDELTKTEATFLNAHLLQFVFGSASGSGSGSGSSSGLVPGGQHHFHVVDPEYLIELLKRQPLKNGCQRGRDECVHVHIAHFQDRPPAIFGGLTGSWLKSGPGYGLPDVILKAHDHYRSPKVHTSTPWRAVNPQWIPTFEAGQNGVGIGRLTLAVSLAGTLECDWRIVPPGQAQKFDESDLTSMGVGATGGRAKSYPVIAKTGIAHGPMGGNMFDTDELYRAITLFLRSVAHRPDGKDTLIIASPSLVMTDSRIDGSRVGSSRIDLFDIGHVFGYREELRAVGISTEKDLVDGILTALGDPHLGATGLPPMEGGAPVPQQYTWKDALDFWHHAEDTWPEDVEVGRVLCLRYHTEEYLIVGPPVLQKGAVAPGSVRVYPLVQTNGPIEPKFQRGKCYWTLDAWRGKPKVSFPITVYSDRFLTRCFGWRNLSRPLVAGKLMQVVAEYVAECDRLGVGLWT